MVYTANWGIICHLPLFRGTRNNHWFTGTACTTNRTDSSRYAALPCPSSNGSMRSELVEMGYCPRWVSPECVIYIINLVTSTSFWFGRIIQRAVYWVMKAVAYFTKIMSVSRFVGISFDRILLCKYMHNSWKQKTKNLRNTYVFVF